MCAPHVGRTLALTRASPIEQRLRQVRAVRAQLPTHADFARVALPAADCDALRDTLVAERARVVVEIGLAYGASALAIGEALCATAGAEASHVIIDPHQARAFDNAGWDALQRAGLGDHSTLIPERSSLALPRLAAEGFTADVAFVDGSHKFHEVFVDLYYLRRVVRPGGLIILDDAAFPSVATALRYYDLNLGWRRVEIGGRLTARRLPPDLDEPDFTDFKAF